MLHPTIIQFIYPEKSLTPKYLDRLADLVQFYWRYRFDNPMVYQMIEFLEIPLEMFQDL